MFKWDMGATIFVVTRKKYKLQVGQRRAFAAVSADGGIYRIFPAARSYTNRRGGARPTNDYEALDDGSGVASPSTLLPVSRSRHLLQSLATTCS
eukprot:6189887-Pleurochrysis_carterae.AAC.2